MKHPAVIFDLDGTLVDSLPDIAAAMNALLAELGRKPLPQAVVARMVGDGSAKLVERALQESGAGHLPLAPQLERFLALYEARATTLTRPYPDVPKVLEALRDAGCPLAVCTNKPERATRAVLGGLGLDRFFAVVLGGDSLPTKKPDPRPLLAVLDRLEVAPADAAMVGDHVNDIAAARGAAMPAILARYGYGAATLAGIMPDATIDRFTELPATLSVIWRPRPWPSAP